MCYVYITKLYLSYLDTHLPSSHLQETKYGILRILLLCWWTKALSLWISLVEMSVSYMPEMSQSSSAALLRWTSQDFCEWLCHCYGLLFIYWAVNASACSPCLSLNFPDSHTHSVQTPISLRPTHVSCAHMVLCCQCMIDFSGGFVPAHPQPKTS